MNARLSLAIHYLLFTIYFFVVTISLARKLPIFPLDFEERGATYPSAPDAQ
jgi:hypothetical protein